MKNEKLIYLTAFLLSLSLILLLEAGTLRLLAEDIKPVEKKEIAVELLLSASNNPAAENTKIGNNEEFMESKNEQEENDSKEKEAKNEEADKSSSAEKEKMELEKNDQFVKEEEETEEKIEESKNENQKAEDKEETDNKKPAEQEETPSEKNIEKKQDTMPAWLNNSETKVEKENSKETESGAESKKEDKFDLESYLAELENNDSAVQKNKVNKNDENKSEENLSGNEPEAEGENGENKTENWTENKKDTAAEAAQNNEEKEVYDLREAGSGIKKPGIENYSQPDYPSNLRKRNIEGKVIISLRIDREGRAHDLKINQSSGYDSFDQAALKAVSSWEFKAAEKDGKKVGVIINLPIRFELN